MGGPRVWDPARAEGAWSWQGEGGRGKPPATPWTCLNPKCNCKKNKPHFWFCKHCHTVRGESVPPPSDGVTVPVRDAPLPPGPLVPGAGGHAPTELEQMVSLAKKLGDTDLAKQYQSKVDNARKAATTEPPLQQQINQAYSESQGLEVRLNAEIDTLEKWECGITDKKQQIADLRLELQQKDTLHCSLVAKLHAETHKQQKPPVPVLRVRDIVAGEEQAFKFDTSGLFAGLEEYDISPQDQETMDKRMAELDTGLQQLVKNLFGECVRNIDQIKATHEAHLTRLQKKRKAMPPGEQQAARPDEGDGGDPGAGSREGPRAPGGAGGSAGAADSTKQDPSKDGSQPASASSKVDVRERARRLEQKGVLPPVGAADDDDI